MKNGKKCPWGLVVLLCCLWKAEPLWAHKLVINSMHSDPTAKLGLQTIVDMFRSEHKGIDVVINTVDHESYKMQIRTWLPNNPPDVATWFAGNRAQFFIEKGLIEPIDDIWAKAADDFTPATRKVASYKGHAYLLPITYYPWGFFYRKDLFKQAGIQGPPQTWDDLLQAVKKLRVKKLVPIAIGTKHGWPAAAWFDYINLRKHGYEFYMHLLSGKGSYLDAKVKESMDLWAALIHLDAFPKNASALSWQEATALLWQGKSAMYLMGQFITSEIPAHLETEIGFFPFPTIDSNVARTEVAPTDVYFIPKKAKNKKNAKLFLSYLAKPHIQARLNRISRLLAPNQKADLKLKDTLLVAGRNSLAAAVNLTQFFDRDASPEVANKGMDAFVEFMHFPDRRDKILAMIEKTRKRVHRSM